MKLNSIVLGEKSDVDQNIHDVVSLVKNAKAANEIRRNTRGFALENDDGSIVKVFVRLDQADDFEQALSKELYDADEEGIEIPEVLFNLRQHFEIVDIEWGNKSIPEDEEEPEQVKKSNKKNDDLPPPDEEGGEEGDLPPPDEEGGEDGDLPPPDESDMPMDDSMGGMDDMMGGAGGAQEDLIGAIGKVMDMLKAKADAEKAEADAKKAEAEAKIASEANKAASMRAAQEEEVLDMEDYNKKQDANKKMVDTRDKLIKYRHELKNNSKQSKDLGESMNIQPDKKKFPDATPEEEEVLDMEHFEKKKKEREQAKKTRERLLKFRHAQKLAKKGKKAVGEGQGFKSALQGLTEGDINKIRSVSFGKFNQLVEAQLNEDGINTKRVAQQIFEKMKDHPQFKGYVACNFQQIENIVNKVLEGKVRSDSDRKHIAVELYGMLQDVKDRHK